MMRKLFATLAAVLFVLCGCAKTQSSAMPPFQEFFPANAAKPPQQLSQKTFTSTEGHALAVAPATGDQGLQTAADTALQIGTIRFSDAKGAGQHNDDLMTLIVEIRATSSRPEGQHIPKVAVPLALRYVCRRAKPDCSAVPQHIDTSASVLLEPTHALSLNPWSDDSNRFTRIAINGAQLAVLAGRNDFMVQAPPRSGWQEADVFLALARPLADAHVQLVSLRSTMMQGKFANTPPEPPSKRQYLRQVLGSLPTNGLTLFVALAAFLSHCAMAVQLWRKKASPEDAPRLFAALLFVYGWILAFAPLVQFAWGTGGAGGWYFFLVGSAFATSGMLAWFGKPAAAHRSLSGLAIAAAWSLVEHDVNSRQFISQIGMPAIFAIYMLWLARDGRLENGDQED